ncbi:leucyl/phenylalanyl-tRNA--protein transferase [Pedobacter sp. MC2016-24]|uniref:leucyl/phenylalanyl-tRNA--protein transferase n=1 Tax=Pedobacter sp. MC2016-24 TaxID=2780090 RepID=UPI0018807E45|nr:leucyl/phenylalanyl-tRNA--protein transferase [Pedobacter sp. MC2016-24]MBE9600525.1 leucyl/phenylalanyl-tRNA--protein transferase [Pedobacter sp. MC2016-24]
MVFRLDDDAIIFPDPALAEEDGLLAIGGDLRPERLVLAYNYGIFPWFNEDDPICWYAPHERCVIYPERVKLSKSMAKVLKSNVFRLSFDEAFASVIGHCATVARRDQPGTWITGQMQQAYIRLHELGYAHSVEVWQGEQLVGGLYGVQINNVFCGESMFSLVSNASKTALIWLCQEGGYTLIDCQLPNDHLMSLGAEMISRDAYQEILS